MPIGKKIVRRKPGSPPMKNYFTADTQRAIVRYQQEPDEALRHGIYVAEIRPAFDALIENLINVFGYRVLYETKEDLRAECMGFLWNAINKYDESRGSKAFSYFNVIAKNWLTIRSKKNAKDVQTFVSIDNRESFSQRELDLIENYNSIPARDEQTTLEEQHGATRKLLVEIQARIKTDNETTCMNAVNLLFEHAEDLDFVNKRAVMLYIREITKLSPKQLSIVLSNLKKHYKSIKAEQEE
jgi:hypothetical protein